MIMHPHELTLQKGRAIQGSRERVTKWSAQGCWDVGLPCESVGPVHWPSLSTGTSGAASAAGFPVLFLIQLTVSPRMLSKHHCLSFTSVPRQFVCTCPTCNSPQSQCHLQNIGLLHLTCSPSDRPLQMAFWFWVLPWKVLPQQLNLFTCYNAFCNAKWISFMDWKGCSNNILGVSRGLDLISSYLFPSFTDSSYLLPSDSLLKLWGIFLFLRRGQQLQVIEGLSSWEKAKGD